MRGRSNGALFTQPAMIESISSPVRQGFCGATRETGHAYRLAALRKLERFRAFMRFCLHSVWITENFAGS